jgi:DNA-binding Xre family transcriptional regulator
VGSALLKSEKIRAVLARNMRAMLATQRWSENELARRSKVSQKQINNIAMERTGCGIDALDAIANAFACEPWQLLLADFHRISDVPARSARVVHSYVGMPRADQEAAERLIFGLAKK